MSAQQSPADRALSPETIRRVTKEHSVTAAHLTLSSRLGAGHSLVAPVPSAAATAQSDDAPSSSSAAAAAAAASAPASAAALPEKSLEERIQHAKAISALQKRERERMVQEAAFKRTIRGEKAEVMACWQALIESAPRRCCLDCDARVKRGGGLSIRCREILCRDSFHFVC
jgi:hypothetical protein